MKASRILNARLESWLLWMIVTAIGWSISLFAVLAIAIVLSPTLPETVSLVIGGAAGGALLGLAQWLFLRPAVRRSDVWTLASAVGWVVGLAVAALVIGAMSPTAGAIIGGALGGAVFGLAQSSALRAGIRRGAGWILTTATGWTVALMAGIALRGEAGPGSMPVVLTEIAGSWTTGGVVVGLVLIVLLVTLFPRTEEKDARTPIDWWP